MTLLIIEICNFVDCPTGGQLSFVRNMLRAFPEGELKLVGITTDSRIPVRQWANVTIDGKKFDFYALKYRKNSSGKPLIPQRIQDYLLVRRYCRRFLATDYDYIFVQAPEVLLGLPEKMLGQTLVDLPGVGNPLEIARYNFARKFSRLYDIIYLPRLTKVRRLWATASKNEIKKMVERSGNCLNEDSILQLPTRYDSSVFRYEDHIVAREKLALPQDQILVITVGRLNWFKGWKLMLDAFRIFHSKYDNSKFIFIGDGEDEQKITSYANALGIEDSISLVGRQKPANVALYLNASNLFIMGSFAEGWSTTLVEACACGIPCVVTDFSSAEEMIKDGVNGYVVRSRDEEEFAEKMERTLKLDADIVRNYDSRFGEYSLDSLREEMLMSI